MKASRPFRTLLILFALVLAFYLASFYGVEYLRHRKGPWVMRFDRATDGTPIVEISQPHLGINGTRIVFRGEVYTNAAETVSFALPEPTRPVPFGRVIYEDLTFLPGVVTLDLFGHEIELVPRTLVVNRLGLAWETGMEIFLTPTNKPATPPQPPSALPKKSPLSSPRS